MRPLASGPYFSLCSQNSPSVAYVFPPPRLPPYITVSYGQVTKSCCGPACGLKPICTIRLAVWDTNLSSHSWDHRTSGLRHEVDQRGLAKVSDRGQPIGFGHLPRSVRIEGRATSDKDLGLLLVDNEAVDFARPMTAATPAYAPTIPPHLPSLNTSEPPVVLTHPSPISPGIPPVAPGSQKGTTLGTLDWSSNRQRYRGCREG